MNKIIHQLRKGLILLVVLVVALAIIPLTGVPKYWILYLFLFFIYLAMANIWNLLAGYSGLLSLCQPAFIGLAGYTLAIVTWFGLPFYLGIIGGAIVAAVFAMLISIPLFRLRGIYFAIGTLVVPELLKIVFFLWRPIGGALLGGGVGYMIKGRSELSMTETYWLALAIGIISIFLVRIILQSELGLGLTAISDNDRTAASSGVGVFKLKLFVFVIGSLVTGIAGAIFYIYQGFIEPVSAFNIRWTMTLMLATVIGGIGSEVGPILGTIIIVFLHFLLAKYAGISLLIQGAILIGIMLLVPQGIIGFIRKTLVYHPLQKLIGRYK